MPVSEDRKFWAKVLRRVHTACSGTCIIIA